MPSPDPKRKRPTPATPPGTSTGSDTEASPPTVRPHSAPAAIGVYRVLDELGRGGMGVVYRAEDPQLRREVALKVMLPQFAANAVAKSRFVREARAQARVEHDHVAVIHHIGEHAGVPFLVMPLLRGMTLQAALKANPRPPLPEVVRIAREVAEGLAAAHEQGLVHRDIKPANVWLEGNKLRVKVLDFGLARAAADAEAASSDGPVTSEGAVLGTPLYMSPEQARGLALDARTDLWSLGVILYQMTVGELPFRGKNTLAILTALGTENPPPPHELNPAVPPALSALILRLLSKNPAGRPASAETVVEELRQIELSLAAGVRVIPLDSLAGTVALAGPDPFAELDATELNSVVSMPSRAAAGPGALGGAARRVPNGMPVWVIATAALVGVAGVVWFVAQTLGKKPQPEVVQHEDPDPHPQPVTPKPKDKATVGPERAAAEWVLSIGGTVKVVVGGEEREVKTAADLPVGPFQLTLVHLNDNNRVTDAGLAHLKNCPNLLILHLGNTKLTDAGLEHLRNAGKLRSLDLSATGVTDPGLRHLKNGTQLGDLRLDNTKVSDAGLDQLAGCSALTSLSLASNPRFTPSGLTKLHKFPALRTLDLGGCDLTDAHLTSLNALPLTYLSIVTNPRLTDAGLANLGVMKSLTNLKSDGVLATETGLKTIAENMPALQTLHFSNSAPALTNAAIANLSRTRIRQLQITDSKLTPETCTPLPRCVIDLNGKRIEPSDAHWREANRLLTHGGHFITVQLPSGPHTAGNAGELPGEPLTVIAVENVAGYSFGDDDLKRLAELRTIQRLTEEGSQVTDAGLKHLASHTELTVLNIGRTMVTDAGLVHLAGLAKLESITLFTTDVTDAGLKHLAGLKKLRLLNLGDTVVSDAAIETLAGMKSLTELVLMHTRVTDAGRQRLQAALPQCTIKWQEPNRLIAERLLSQPGFELTLKFPDGNELVATKPAHLPANPFTVVRVQKTGSDVPFGDADLRRLLPLAGLTVLEVSNGQLTDDGLALLTRFPALNQIVLQLNRQLTDRGLAHLKGSTRLQSVHLEHTGVGDAGVAHLAGNQELVYLNLSGTKITEAALDTITRFSKLQSLNLTGSPITARGLARLAELKHLSVLQLQSTQIDDAGLVHLRGMKQLTQLDMGSTAVTDAGLIHLAELKNLTVLGLGDTGVTEAGRKKLQAALPGCKIYWADPARLIAERVLKAGGSLGIRLPNKSVQNLSPGDRVPDGPFEFNGISLGNQTDPNAVVAGLRGLLHVEHNLSISGPAVTDATLKQLVALPGPPTIPYLGITNTQMTDGGLAHLTGFKGMQRLDLSGNRIGDAGLVHLRDMPGLTFLELRDTNVTDAGVETLAAMKALTNLDLSRTRMTEAGLKKLQAALPKCTILWEPATFGLKFAPKDVVEVPGLTLPFNDSYTIEGFVTLAVDRAETVWWSTAVSAAGAHLGVVEGRWRWYTFHGAAVGLAPVAARTHVAGVRTPTERRLYVNGKLVAKSDGGTVNPAKEEPVFRIGGGEFVGVVREVRVSKVARYDKDFTPAERHEPDKDTIALYHCDDGEGDTLKDSSGNNRHGTISGAKWVISPGEPPKKP